MRTLVLNNNYCALLARNASYRRLTSLEPLREYYAAVPDLWVPCNCPNGYKGVGVPEIPGAIYHAVARHPHFEEDVLDLKEHLKFDRVVVTVGGFRSRIL